MDYTASGFLLLLKSMISKSKGPAVLRDRPDDIIRGAVWNLGVHLQYDLHLRARKRRQVLDDLTCESPAFVPTRSVSISTLPWNRRNVGFCGSGSGFVTSPLPRS